jgi:glycosyltransferase involved in cell wall biosynthesis
MRVLYFSTGYGPHDHRFLTALAGTKHEVHFLRLVNAGHLTEDGPVPPPIRTVRWQGAGAAFQWRDVPRLVVALRRIIQEVQPDLIHAGPIQTCAFLAVLSGFRPVLTMCWGFDLMQDADRNAWWRWVTRYTLRRSSFFVSDAQVTRARAVAFGMRKDRTEVFPWGVDLKKFRPDSRRGSSPARLRSTARFGNGVRSARKRSFVLLCNRSWEPRYGVDLLARAFVLAARQHDGLSLLLLGGGTEESRIRRILQKGGQLDRVQFTGHVAQMDLPRWYHRADLFISPSHIDGSSVSLMEALACGSAILVSDIPANKEWIRQDVNGWMFRDGDTADLAGKILWISSRPGVIPRIRREARKVAEARADWSTNFKVLLRAYERALAAQ